MLAKYAFMMADFGVTREVMKCFKQCCVVPWYTEALAGYIPPFLALEAFYIQHITS